MGRDRPLERNRARLHARGRRPAARLAPDRALARPPRRREALAPARRGGLHRGARRAHRRPGRADGEGRAEGDLPLRLAGGGRRQPRRGRLPGSEPLSREQRAGDGAPAQQRAAARRPDRVGGGQDDRRRLPAPDRRRRRGRLRRPAERVRADEGDDRGAARRASTSRTSSRRRRSAATSAARCSCRPAQFIRTLLAARLAADVLGVPTLVDRPHRRRRRDAADERRRRARRARS